MTNETHLAAALTSFTPKPGALAALPCDDVVPKASVDDESDSGRPIPRPLGATTLRAPSLLPTAAAAAIERLPPARQAARHSIDDAIAVLYLERTVLYPGSFF